MDRIAKFFKVSYNRYKADYQKLFSEKNEDIIKEIYDKIILPKRAAQGSAGYDFYSPVSFVLNPGETINVPTGVRVRMNDGWVLCLFPRSGLGFKYRLQLNNTVGIIDSDYFGSENEGHIFIKITNDTNENKTININASDGFVQGIFLPFGITDDDECENVRYGGFGSTDR